MDPQMRAELAHDGTMIWIVEGRGMTFIHHQQWQAEVKYHYLCSSAGVSTARDQLRDLESTGVGGETN